MLSVVVHSENLTFRSVNKTPVGDLSNFQPFILCKVVPTFKSVEKTRNRAIYMKAIK